MAHPGAASLATDETERARYLTLVPDDDAGDEATGSATRQAHEDAVLRMLRLMREGFSSDLTLGDMASAALFSPYYANRLFRLLTGVQPRRFLSAIRFDAAKRLLAESSLSVTAICNEVGYTSLGSFTSRFHQGVGVSPRAFRRYARGRAARLRLDTLFDRGAPNAGGAVIRGSTSMGTDDEALTFIGLFPTPVPQGLPFACALARTPGSFELSCSREGRAFLLAVAMPEPDSMGDCLLPAESDLRVASQALVVRDPGSGPVIEVEVRLRSLEPTDPPIVTALPYLLERMLKGRASRGSNGVDTNGVAASR
ncbi:MAG TPA: AraC family transcriptional regulator [Nitriliruptorales bacterium]|nr:AraC family transcriptional regulator [Nitriliruptorales bacterium]